MKKRPINHQTYNSKKRKLLSSIIFFSILLVVALIALYLIFSSKDISLSPNEGNYLSGPNSESILSAIGITKKGNNPASTWFATKGKTSFTDSQGNTYGEPEYFELSALLDPGIIKEYSGGIQRINPFGKKATPTPAPNVINQPTATPIKTPTPTPYASATASTSIKQSASASASSSLY